MRIYPWIIHPKRNAVKRNRNINGGFPLQKFLMEDYRQYKKIIVELEGLSQENTERTNGNQCSGFIRNWYPICLLGILAKGVSLKVFLTIIQGVTMNRPCKWFMNNYIILFIIILAQWNNYPWRHNLQPYKIGSILSRILLFFTGLMTLAFK